MTCADFDMRPPPNPRARLEERARARSRERDAAGSRGVSTALSRSGLATGVCLCVRGFSSQSGNDASHIGERKILECVACDSIPPTHRQQKPRINRNDPRVDEILLV